MEIQTTAVGGVHATSTQWVPQQKALDQVHSIRCGNRSATSRRPTRGVHSDEHLSVDVTTARLRLPPHISTITTRPHHQSISGGHILPRRRCRNQGQHQEVPLVNSLTGVHGQSLRPHTIYSRVYESMLCNVHMRTHRDKYNMEGALNILIPVLKFRQGQIWIEEELEPDLSPGGQHRGRQHEVKLPGIEFSRFTQHGTCPWKSDRVVLSAYTAQKADEISNKDKIFLGALGFTLQHLSRTARPFTTAIQAT